MICHRLPRYVLVSNCVVAVCTQSRRESSICTMLISCCFCGNCCCCPITVAVAVAVAVAAVAVVAE